MRYYINLRISQSIIFFVLVFSSRTLLAQVVDFDVEREINRANVIRTCCSDKMVYLYQGNGVFGCLYGKFGLHVNPENILQNGNYGKTQFMNLPNFMRGKYGSDNLVPLAKIYWENEPLKTSDYLQVQSFYDGIIDTQFRTGKNKIQVRTWFDPVQKELAGITITKRGVASDVILAPFTEMTLHYGDHVNQSVNFEKHQDQWLICYNNCDGEQILTGKSSKMYLKTNAIVSIKDNKLHLKLIEGENVILLTSDQPIKTESSESLSESIEWWHKKWMTMGCLSLPDENAQKMWVRSMAAFLMSSNDIKSYFPTPNGLTGNGWPFPFPQDLSFISPVLMSTGNFDIVKSWVEKWAESASEMRNYTRRLLDIDGIFCPWVFPYGSFEGYHKPSTPNIFYYEIHNSGYLSKMASDIATFVNDSSWTKKFALPLIKGTAEFYKNICRKEKDGLWHIQIIPSDGQDESGGQNQRDYLCALSSARYCFNNAIQYGLDVQGSYSRILKDGLAFNSLMSSKGYYYTCRGSGNDDFGKQKHPIQLNTLTYIPGGEAIENASIDAYNLRYEITLNAKKPFFYGWSLGSFLLAGSRVGDVKGWQKDWANLRLSDMVDPEWVQIYETSEAYTLSFYTTTNGLIAQSLINNLISDWSGKLEIAKCYPWQGNVFVKDIYSLLGVKISGKIDKDSSELFLSAWKDCDFNLLNKNIRLKKNESIIVKLDLKSQQIISTVKVLSVTN